MKNETPSRAPYLPHHKLVAWQVACELLMAVKAANIRCPRLRDQALRAATSACTNVAEAASRVSPADKARVFGLARCEAAEAAGAAEVAGIAGHTSEEHAKKCVALGARLYALLCGLCR
jgi:four helix bundle protein